MNALERRFVAAQRIAQEAAHRALGRRESAAVRLKGTQDWVTEADTEVEDFIAAALAEEFPDDGFLGEEAGHRRAGALRWVVDPIDGTANYMRGSPRFCVSIGLLDAARPLLGVIAAPALGEVFTGLAGQGAWLNERPIRVAATAALDRAQVELAWSPRRPPDEFLELCRRVTGTGAVLRLGGSGALALADVACGRSDAYAEQRIRLWDVAAGLCILAEAGAVTSDFLARDAGEAGSPILAAAPGIAAALKAACGDLLD